MRDDIGPGDVGSHVVVGGLRPPLLETVRLHLGLVLLLPFTLQVPEPDLDLSLSFSTRSMESGIIRRQITNKIINHRCL